MAEKHLICFVAIQQRLCDWCCYGSQFYTDTIRFGFCVLFVFFRYTLLMLLAM